MKKIKKYRFLFFITVLSLIFFSCNSSNGGLMPQLKTTDSAAVIYYDTPGNPRFYTFTKVSGMEHMSPVIKDANRKTIDGMEDCISHGKIYFYSDKGAVYVIYFGDMKECMTLSFIINGEKYFSRMSNESKKLLDEYRLKAKPPGTGNQN